MMKRLQHNKKNEMESFNVSQWKAGSRGQLKNIFVGISTIKTRAAEEHLLFCPQCRQNKCLMLISHNAKMLNQR